MGTSTRPILPRNLVSKERAAHVWALIKEDARLLGPSAKFLTTCEAHTYAYSVAANAILALVPFLVLLVTIANLTAGPDIRVSTEAKTPPARVTTAGPEVKTPPGAPIAGSEVQTPPGTPAAGPEVQTSPGTPVAAPEVKTSPAKPTRKFEVRRSPAKEMIFELVREYLPAGADRLTEDLKSLTAHHGVQVFSFIMLAISASGVFLPFEVALNGVWGFKKNRSYIGNQIISLALVGACAVLAYSGVVLAAIFKAVLVKPIPFLIIQSILGHIIIRLFAIPLTIVSFWIVFWWLPNGKVPAMQVFPAAFYTGLLAEVFKMVFGWILPLLDFKKVYGDTFWLPVTLLVWTYAGAVLLLFGASLSARGVIKLPRIKFMHGHATQPEQAAVTGAGAQE